ncbi:hypothetical protein N7481_000398 [Penicillium waksmanii]|uniref:uncharacterized protein n=1 Tax=Penicillium waksmanii TaxID=69791 RepID=UPI002547956F|nr:uncharacterized protein N7481_000398 [Penicillium waksmanii]KAJ5999989.1 hypothetical protein N7481_000398 [Penicillium waksmanii]
MTDPNMRGTPPARQPDSKAAPTSSSTSSSTANPSHPSTGPSQSANTSTSTSNNANPPSQPSLATRIQSSATGLARSALTGPSDYAQTLNTATQGKTASSSSASASASGSGLNYATNSNNHAPYSSSAQPQQHTPAPTFRNTTTTTNQPGAFSIPNLTEEEFQRVYTDIGTYGRAYYDAETGTGTITGIDTDTYADINRSNLSQNESENNHDHDHDHETLQSNNGPWKGKHRLQDPVQLEYTTAWERASPHTFTAEPTHTYTPVSTDGDAISALLSDPSFDAAGYDDDENYNVDLDLEAQLAPLSDEEVKMLESFRRDMDIGMGPGSGSGFDNRTIPQGSVPLSSVSLVPDIDAFLNEHDPEAGAGVGAGAVSLRDRVLSELPGSNEWVGVQERYHDEVWGYLRPALEAAREEIEEKGVEGDVEGQGHDGDGPAVRRLKMILKHMGG